MTTKMRGNWSLRHWQIIPWQGDQANLAITFFIRDFKWSLFSIYEPWSVMQIACICVIALRLGSGVNHLENIKIQFIWQKAFLDIQLHFKWYKLRDTVCCVIYNTILLHVLFINVYKRLLALVPSILIPHWRKVLVCDNSDGVLVVPATYVFKVTSCS
jgi:hypothetical protein